MAKDTRGRVLDVTLALLNERGAARVTTAEIAAAAGINEGNLYYWFQRKEHLIEALFERFEAALLQVATGPVSCSDPAAFASYQRGWFRLMWSWRCFYRDAAALYTLAPSLRARVRTVHTSSQASVRAVLQEMVVAGLLDAPPEVLDRLLTNLWIVSTYWIDYIRLRHGAAALRPEHLEWGYAQLSSLYEPYLTAQGRPLASALATLSLEPSKPRSD